MGANLALAVSSSKELQCELCKILEICPPKNDIDEILVELYSQACQKYDNIN